MRYRVIGDSEDTIETLRNKLLKEVNTYLLFNDLKSLDRTKNIISKIENLQQRRF